MRVDPLVHKQASTLPRSDFEGNGKDRERMPRLRQRVTGQWSDGLEKAVFVRSLETSWVASR